MSRGTSLFVLLLVGALHACGQSDSPVDQTEAGAQADAGAGGGQQSEDRDQGPTADFLTGDQASADGGSALIELGSFDPAVHGRVWVKVVREKTGEPLVDAPVELIWSRGGTSAGTVVSETDEEGLARFPLRSRTLVQSVNAGGTGHTAPQLVRLDTFLETGEREPEVIVVQEAARFAGQVIDTEGDPVVDAEVQCWANDRLAIEGLNGAEPTATGRTDADGRFRIGGMPGGSFVISAEQFGMVTTRRAAGVNKFDEEIENITLVMRTAHAVSGVVVDTEGKGIEKAVVEAGERNRWKNATPSGDDRFVYIPARQWKLETAADGGFMLPAVPDGTLWIIRAEHGQYLNQRTRLEADLPVIELRLDRGLEIHAQVLDANAQPIVTGDMVVLGKSNRSAPIRQGFASLSGLQEDVDAIVVLRSPGQAMKVIWPVQYNTKESPIKIVLDPAQPIRGQVLDTGGDPLPETRLVARGLDFMQPDLLEVFPGKQPEEIFQINEQLSDETGAFSFPTLYGGNWEIVATAPDGRTKTQVIQAGELKARIIF